VTESIPVGFPWRLFTFSLILFLFSVFVFFGLKFGYVSYLTSETNALDKKIQDLGNRVSAEDQARFIAFYSQLANLKKILDNHGFSGNIFSFLEKNTLGQVYYNDAGFSGPDGELTLKGFAASSETLVSQLAIFDKAPEVAKVVLNQTNTDQRGVTFALTLTFRADFFKTPSL
jgi:energy-coupling factor transporter transmembrane protein EcfT